MSRLILVVRRGRGERVMKFRLFFTHDVNADDVRIGRAEPRLGSHIYFRRGCIPRLFTGGNWSPR